MLKNYFIGLIIRPRKIIKVIIAYLKRRKIVHKDFTIISQNCTGARIYQELGIQYNSPTIGLYFESHDFIKFIENLEVYLDKELTFDKELSRYPIGYLDDIKIHFLHYSNNEEAYLKWNKRKKRINFDRLFFIYTDRDGFKQEYLERYEKIKYKNKIFLSAIELRYPSVIYIKEHSEKECVDNPYKDKYWKKHFDYIKWLNS